MKRNLLLLFLILALGLSLRLYGIRWDQGHNLHPDERFLTFVALDTSWPTSVAQYLDTPTSPLNPMNVGHTFFVYGTAPIFLVKAVSEAIGAADYATLPQVGRALSALIDTGTIALVYVSAAAIGLPTWVGLAGALLYALAPLPIQLSHFYTTDPYLTFFLALTLYIALLPPTWTNAALLGISMGLAVGSKISAVYMIPTIIITYVLHVLRGKSVQHLMRTVSLALPAMLCGYLTLRAVYPYLFASGNLLDVTINPMQLASWDQLAGFNTAESMFPPGIQWITTVPYIFPLIQTIWLGLGVPLALLAGLGAVVAIGRLRVQPMLLVFLFWIVSLGAYQGMQFTKALRYFAPLYPALALLAGLGAYTLVRRLRLRAAVVLLPVMLWSAGVLWGIYSMPHTRVAASGWICATIPPGSILAIEHWDDGLPLALSQQCNSGNYQSVELPLYAPDTQEKWLDVSQQLAQSDYVLLTSNRLYGSISSVPTLFPYTARYYDLLFGGALGFERVAEFIARPHLPLPFLTWCIRPSGMSYGAVSQIKEACPGGGITLIDDYGDETWTVYDHPKVTIFKNAAHFSAEELFISVTQDR